jgi:hypothetical protein
MIMHDKMETIKETTAVSLDYLWMFYQLQTSNDRIAVNYRMEKNEVSSRDVFKNSNIPPFMCTN